MDAIEKQKLIISLIRDDLINSKLVNGLANLGLDAGMYSLYLSQTIFELMGFDDSLENEPLFERYLALLEQSKFISISESHDPLNTVAENIYQEMMARS